MYLIFSPATAAATKQFSSLTFLSIYLSICTFSATFSVKKRVKVRANTTQTKCQPKAQKEHRVARYGQCYISSHTSHIGFRERRHKNLLGRHQPHSGWVKTARNLPLETDTMHMDYLCQRNLAIQTSYEPVFVEMFLLHQQQHMKVYSLRKWL